MKYAFHCILAFIWLASIPIASASTLWEDTITSLNPVGWWRLNDTTLTTAIDATTNNYDGTYVGGPALSQAPAFDSGTNLSVRFDRNSHTSGDHVIIGDVLDFGASDEFTLMAWIKASRLSSTGTGASMKVVNKGLTTAGTPSDAGYDILLRDSLLQARIRDGSNNSAIASVAEPSSNEWHFVVAVLNRSSDELLLYLDPMGGSAAATVDASSVGSLATNIPLAFGALDRTGGTSTDISEYFDGHIDEVVIFNKALTGGEIQTAFIATVPVPESTTLALTGLGLAGIGYRRRQLKKA
jgi:hypothetical protein